MPTLGDTDTPMLDYITEVDRAIDTAVEHIMGHKLSKEKRIEPSLPGKYGGSGLANLHTAVPASYISTIIAMIPIFKSVTVDG